MDNLGQWKYTQAENPDWNKKALSWPVMEDGSNNEVCCSFSVWEKCCNGFVVKLIVFLPM